MHSNIHSKKMHSACNIHSKKMHIYIYLHTYAYAYICTRTHTRMYDTIHMLKYWYWDPQSMHKYAYTYTYTCVATHRCTNTCTHAYIYMYTCPHTYTHTHIHTHTYKMYIWTHASTPGMTVWERTREEPLQTQEALHDSFVRRNQATFRTSNARTSLYPLPETPIPLHPPSPLPNTPYNSSWTADMRSFSVLHWSEEQSAYLEEAPRSFIIVMTRAPCVVVERLEGKQRCSRAAVCEHAGI